MSFTAEYPALLPPTGFDARSQQIKQSLLIKTIPPVVRRWINDANSFSLYLLTHVTFDLSACQSPYDYITASAFCQFLEKCCHFSFKTNYPNLGFFYLFKTALWRGGLFLFFTSFSLWVTVRTNQNSSMCENQLMLISPHVVFNGFYRCVRRHRPDETGVCHRPSVVDGYINNLSHISDLLIHLFTKWNSGVQSLYTVFSGRILLSGTSIQQHQ